MTRLASLTSGNDFGIEQQRCFTSLTARLARMWPQLSSTRMRGRMSSNLNNHELLPAQVSRTTAARCRCYRLSTFLLRTRTATSCVTSSQDMHVLGEPLDANSCVRHAEGLLDANLDRQDIFSGTP